MATPDNHQELFPLAASPPGAAFINGRCQLQTFCGHRVVSVSGIILAQYATSDLMSEAYAMVSLVEQGHAGQNEVARAFDCSTRTVRRYQERFASGGLTALARIKGYPIGRPRLPPSRDRTVTHLKAEGCSNGDIGRRFGVTEKAIRKQLKRLGWREQAPIQPLLLTIGGSDPNLSVSQDAPLRPAMAEACQVSDLNLSAFIERPSCDHNPEDRATDRCLARAGLLHDAAPVFSSCPTVPRAGVLLAIPALLKTGVFDCAKAVYGDIGPAFYGLRTTVLTMLFMALLRIKRPEALKEHAPAQLGRLLGLDRAPEVKTLRRKITMLAAFNRAVPFGLELARRRINTHGGAMGFLYLDGHVRVYHGRHQIPKAHVTRMRISMPATTDYWVNDQGGEPLFVITAEANEGLAHMLPSVLAQMRGLVGERRVTVVFDRGGWSPKLFMAVIAQGFDILTYRKGRSRSIPLRQFHDCAAVLDERKVSYKLADQGAWLLGGRLRLRQVTRLGDDGHQTHVITSRRDLPAIEVAYRMFERWRQENFFKYLREEYALDALADHQLDLANPERTVPNPLRKAMDRKLREVKLELQELASKYGLDAFTSVEARRRTMRGFKIAASETGRAIAAIELRVARLERRRARLPLRVPVAQVVDGVVVRLSTERKHLTNCLKMVAYQAESELASLIARHYHRAEDEGRTLIHNALDSTADLVVTDTELEVVLAPMSSAHRSKAVSALCGELTALAAVFPGSKLRLRYRVADPV